MAALAKAHATAALEDEGAALIAPRLFDDKPRCASLVVRASGLLRHAVVDLPSIHAQRPVVIEDQAIEALLTSTGWSCRNRSKRTPAIHCSSTSTSLLDSSEYLTTVVG
jgi:hypothetical protein